MTYKMKSDVIPETPFSLTVEISNLMPIGTLIWFNDERESWCKVGGGWQLVGDSRNPTPPEAFIGIRHSDRYKVTRHMPGGSPEAKQAEVALDATGPCIDPAPPPPPTYAKDRDWSCNCALSHVTFDAHVSGAVEKELRAKMEHEPNCRSLRAEIVVHDSVHNVKNPACCLDTVNEIKKTEQKLETEFLEDLLCEEIE